MKAISKKIFLNTYSDANLVGCNNVKTLSNNTTFVNTFNELCLSSFDVIVVDDEDDNNNKNNHKKKKKQNNSCELIWTH